MKKSDRQSVRKSVSGMNIRARVGNNFVNAKMAQDQ
jgi:hypothetical protein